MRHSDNQDETRGGGGLRLREGVARAEPEAAGALQEVVFRTSELVFAAEWA